MPLPRTEIELQPAPQAPNPNDTACLAGCVGVASQGPIGIVRTINRLTDLSEFGFGPGVELAAAVLSRAGGPVRFTRASTGTPSMLSSATKFPAKVDAGILFGGLLLPGADANAEVFVTAKQSGLSVVVVNPGADGALVHSGPTNGVITITLAYAMGATTTTGALLATYINNNLSTYLAAIAQGTGATLASAMAQTAIQNGDLSYLPRQDGVRVRHVASGNNTALTVSVLSKDVTVNLATDANGTPTSTAVQVVTEMLKSSAALLLVTPTASGTGAGFAGVWGYQSLTYGSTASLSLSGTPNDRYVGRLFCTRAGTVGGATPPVVVWSVDRREHDSAPQALPASGILVLQDSQLTTGITATFSGVLAVGDEWYISSTEPVAAQADLVTAVTTILNDPSKPLGFVAVAQPLSRAQAAEVETAVQNRLAVSWAGLMTTVRDENAGESSADWQSAIEVDYLGLYSASGVLRVSAGHAPHVSAYSGRTYHRPAIYFASAARAATPVHVDLGQKRQESATTGGVRRIWGGPILGLGAAEPGAQVIGGVHYAAQISGVAVWHKTQSGNSKPLLLAVEEVATLKGTRYVLTVTLGTDNTGVSNSTVAQVRDAVNAVAGRYVTATQPTAGTATATATAIEIMDRQVTHDEYLSPGLHEARFLTMRSYAEDPGSYYFTQAPTFAAPSASGYTLIEHADVVFSVARIANKQGLEWVNTVLASIPEAESESVPAGALDAQEAERVGADISGPVEAFLYRRKLDGRFSASAYPAGERAATVLRDYDYKESRILQVAVGVYLFGISEVVRLIIQPK